MTVPFVLPGQPIRYCRDRPIKVWHTKLEIELDFDRRSVSGHVTHTIEVIGNQVKTLELDCIEIECNEISLNGKKNVPYELKDGKLRITIGKDESKPKKRLTLSIAYTTTPKKGLIFKESHVFSRGFAEDSRYWFPCFDYPNMRYTSETIVVVPKNMLAVSNGNLVSVRELDDSKKRAFHFKLEVPHPAYLHSIVAGDFVKIEEKCGDVPLEYIVFPRQKALAYEAFKKTSSSMNFFSKITGCNFPYPKYAQCAVSYAPFGASENVTATTITDEVLQDPVWAMDYRPTADNIVVHELAHHWFGNYLTCKDWSHAWLNEGFATYFTALFKEFDEGKDEFQYFMCFSYMEDFLEETSRYQRSIVTKRYWTAHDIFDRHLYQKGAWVLHGLRGLLGEDAFFRGIRLYVSKHASSNVETSDFRKVLEDVSGLNLESFFDQWVYTPGFPVYSAHCVWNEQRHTMRILISQKNVGIEDTPLYDIPIEVRFEFESAEATIEKIRLSRKSADFEFALPEKPLNVSIDPNHWILKELAIKKTKEMFLHQLSRDDSAIERVYACIELSNFPSRDVVEILASRIDKDDFWGVRLQAAKALGRIGSIEALDALMKRVGHSDHRTRRGIAFGLRGFTHLGKRYEDKVVDALIELLEKDVSFYTRGQAAWSLGYYKQSERAFSELERALKQDSTEGVVRKMVFMGFTERADIRAYPLALSYLADGKESSGRVQAIRTIGTLGMGQSDTKDVLLSLEQDSDLRVREEAAVMLGELQDVSVVPFLKEWLEREVWGRVSRRLRESIYILENDK